MLSPYQQVEGLDKMQEYGERFLSSFGHIDTSNTIEVGKYKWYV